MTLAAPIRLTKGPRGGRPQWTFLHRRQMEVYNSRARFKVVVAGRRWGKCLVEDTLIQMWDGSQKPIQDVRPGDIVATINEDTYELQPRRVQDVACNGERDLVRVKTAGREVVGTPHHPMLINNEWVELRDAKPGDLIGVAKGGVFGKRRVPDHWVDMLAIWLAEGHSYTVSNADEQILSIVREAAQAFCPSLRLEHRGGVDWQITNGDRSGGPQKGSNNAVRRFLEDNGLWGKTSKTKFIPDWVFELEPEQLSRFLNLFMACDGSINRRSKNTWAVEIGLANEIMVRQLGALFGKFGLRGQISEKIHKACGKDGEPFRSWRWIASQRESVIGFATAIGAITKERQVEEAMRAALKARAGVNEPLPVRYDAMAEVIERLGNTGRVRRIMNEWRKNNRAEVQRHRFEALREASGDFFGPLADGGVAWERITSVEPAGRGVTYDLSIEGNHNYIANGAVSHNTQLSKVSITKYARRPRQLIWYIAPTYQMARQIMWQELQDAIPRKWIAKINGSTMTIFLKNKTVISLKGADKPDTLRGVGLNYVVLDEFQDMRKETWDTVIQPTLASTRGHALFIGTPKSFNHLYDHYMTGQDPDEDDWDSWQFETITSPFILPEEIDRARRTMSEKEFNQEFRASFESMSNRVYHAFDRSVHVKKCKFDPSKPIIVGMDFNIDPMSAIFMQKHGAELHVFKELSLSNSNTGEMADEIERLFWRHKNQITIYPDPAGTGRSTASAGESDFSILRGKGFKKLRYRRKHPRVRDRINSVNRMLRSADGTVRLYVDHSCKVLIDSLEQTQFKKDGRDIDKTMGLEHATDALGYPIELEYPVRSLRVLGVSI